MTNDRSCAAAVSRKSARMADLSTESSRCRGLAPGAAVNVVADRDMERRLVLACSLPAAEMLTSARVVRAKLTAAARSVAEALSTGDAATA